MVMMISDWYFGNLLDKYHNIPGKKYNYYGV